MLPTGVPVLLSVRLAVFYPGRPLDWRLRKSSARSAVLIITRIGVGLARRCPYLLVGWLWYLGMFGPMIALCSTAFNRADRYTYLPQIDWRSPWPGARRPVLVLALP